MAVTELEEFLTETNPQQIVGRVPSDEIFSRLKAWVSELNDILSRIEPAELNDEIFERLRTWCVSHES